MYPPSPVCDGPEYVFHWANTAKGLNSGAGVFPGVDNPGVSVWVIFFLVVGGHVFMAVYSS